MNLPIPAEIVGTKEELEQRRLTIQSQTFHWANTLGKAYREGRSVDFCAQHVSELSEPWDRIVAESHRRHLAWRLAHPKVNA